jgi:hypothetical protein
MASSVVKKYCTKCREKERLGAVVCNKCQQLFCATCIVEHQQELTAQIDNINREYDILKGTPLSQAKNFFFQFF